MRSRASWASREQSGDEQERLGSARGILNFALNGSLRSSVAGEPVLRLLVKLRNALPLMKPPHTHNCIYRQG